jgi:hypothetical protein
MGNAEEQGMKMFSIINHLTKITFAFSQIKALVDKRKRQSVFSKSLQDTGMSFRHKNRVNNQ